MTLSEPIARDWGAHTIAPGSFVDEHAVSANVTALTLHKDRMVAGLGDGQVVMLRDGVTFRLTTHEGAVTALATTEEGLFTAGQDGVLRHMRWGEAATALVTGKDWITCIATARERTAIASGKTAHVFDRTQRMARFDDHPSTISGLSFSPSGDRLAVSHYNGVTIWQLGDLAEPLRLTWAGSLVAVSWSPDGRYVAAATQDREIHIWDLVTERDFRLGGFQAKPKQIGWTDGTTHLFSSGADVVVAWPLAGDPNAMPPVEIGYAFGATITAVVPLASGDGVLAGYSDGSLILGEVTKGTAKILRAATGAPITAVRFDPASGVGAFGTADGKIGTVRV